MAPCGFADDTRYAGQWRDGQATGLGVREKPGVDRAEGNFVAGRLEGLGVRRTLTEPATVQSGEFRADLLEGPGVETVGDQRYEGGFRGGKRNGYGQVTSADGKVQSGRWEDGKRNRNNALMRLARLLRPSAATSCHP